MPERSRAPGFTYDPFEATREAETAEAAAADAAGIQDPHAARHVQAALGELDLAIAELRHVVFDLHTASDAPAVSRPGGGGMSRAAE
ncbi:hypothetical protein [Actinomadura bangladeshensis]|uniref:Uncharacterized protein n=1 Tax=Actinomadura bangladeshensis TaxID=453573 RepID=A0A4R4P2P6_9ACTN|nr:hypothetical protein [Actinomadura bangladeshensis]TDC16159.1 hypothetical protein E1284_13515 [Actinomadura bangladeshensis]